MRIFLWVFLFLVSSGAQLLACEKDSSGKYSVEIISKTRTQETGVLAEAKTCILRPIQEVWNGTTNFKAILWEGVDRFEAQKIEKPPAPANKMFVVQYFIDFDPVVAWTMNWKHLLLEGSETSPQKITIAFEKTSGTKYIAHWNGVIDIAKVTETVTAFRIENLLSAEEVTEEIVLNQAKTLIKAISLANSPSLSAGSW